MVVPVSGRTHAVAAGHDRRGGEERLGPPAPTTLAPPATRAPPSVRRRRRAASAARSATSPASTSSSRATTSGGVGTGPPGVGEQPGDLRLLLGREVTLVGGHGWSPPSGSGASAPRSAPRIVRGGRGWDAPRRVGVPALPERCEAAAAAGPGPGSTGSSPCRRRPRGARPPRRRSSPACRRGPGRPAARGAACRARRGRAAGQSPCSATSAGSSAGGVRGGGGAAPQLLVEVVGQGLGQPDLAPAEPVEAGVDDDPVQPGRHRGVPPVGLRAPEGRDHRLLERVRGVLRVAGGAQRHRPEPVAVAREQHPEGRRRRRRRGRRAASRSSARRRRSGVGRSRADGRPRRSPPLNPPSAGASAVSHTTR